MLFLRIVVILEHNNLFKPIIEPFDMFDNEPFYNLGLELREPKIKEVGSFREIADKYKLMRYLLEAPILVEGPFTIATNVRRDGLIMPGFIDGLHRYNGKLIFGRDLGYYDDELGLSVKRAMGRWRDLVS